MIDDREPAPPLGYHGPPGGRPIEPTTKSNIVRLFPLREVVLLPMGLLPLRIFEPRYSRMTEDALASDRVITMVQPIDEDADEPVPIHRIGCLGRIAHEQRMPNGKFTFLLRGESRVLIDEEIEDKRPYRQARVTVLEDRIVPGRETLRLLQRAGVLDSLRRYLVKDDSATEQFFRFLATKCDLAAFTDVVGYAAPLDLDVKRELLCTLDVDQRLAILDEALRNPVESAVEWKPYPPGFATN